MPKILIIEDEPGAQKALADVLRLDGYVTTSTRDGTQGLALARTKKPDLILLDVMLPTLDGFQILKALKADASTRHVPVIVLTNLEMPGDFERAVALGATTYLVKTNYELGEIAKRVGDTLRKASPSS